MCECRKGAAPRVMVSHDPLPPGEEWEMECRVTVRRVHIKRTEAVRICGLVTQGGVAGLHAHTLTAHGPEAWHPVVGHP